ncbi:MAG: NAD(P)-dependent oxidoreductase [Bacteroidota bacterium]
MQKKIFITGAKGFIGRNLLPLFNENEFELFCLSRSVTVKQEGNINWVSGSLDTVEQQAGIINSCDFVIHLAGEIGEKAKMEKTNVEGLIKLLSVIIPSEEKGFLYLSSAGIYGIKKQTVNEIDETSPCFPSNEYERTKAEAEKQLQLTALERQLRFIILRPTNVIGENDHRKKLLNLCKALLHNKFLMIRKNAIVNYVYVGDIASLIFKIVNQNDFKNETYNLNSPMQIDFFIQTIKEELNCSYRTKSLPVIFQPLIFSFAKMSSLIPSRFRFIDEIKYDELANSKIISNKKVQDRFGGFSAENLRTGLKKLITYYRNGNEL